MRGPPLQNDPMGSGFNKRMFNTVEYLAGSSITLVGGGDITLQSAGLYRLSGTSIVTWRDLDDLDAFAPSPYPGYAEVKYSSTGDTFITGATTFEIMCVWRSEIGWCF